MRQGICVSVLGLVLAGCGGGGSSSDAPASSQANSGGGGSPTSAFSGVVVDSSGAPISGVTITAYLTNDHTFRTATTDGAGRYAFSGLQAGWPGSYELWADKSGFAFLPSIVSGTGRVLKSDHNALYKNVIEFSTQSALTATDANFTALRAGERVVSLARTGQTVSYTTGDDAAQARGVAWPIVRFTDNGDGTVTDALTGLVWTRNAGCFAAMNWSDALVAVNQLASGACGLTDGSSAGQWRLPNSVELESLIDVAHSNPALPGSHPFLNVGATYWTSTTYRGDTASAWVIRFSDGRYINDSNNNAKTTAFNAVWAVKSTSAAGAISLPQSGQFIVYGSGDDASAMKGVRTPYPRFIDKGDGTVADTATGLIWLKRADCIHQDWTNAVAAVNALADGQCGLTDGSTAGQWRMPNRAEMLSIDDRAETNVALRFNTAFYYPGNILDQAVVFNNFHESEYYWTSSTNAADVSQAWTLYSCDYGVYNIAKSAVGYTLAVR